MKVAFLDIKSQIASYIQIRTLHPGKQIANSKTAQILSLLLPIKLKIWNQTFWNCRFWFLSSSITICKKEYTCTYKKKMLCWPSQFIDSFFSIFFFFFWYLQPTCWFFGVRFSLLQKIESNSFRLWSLDDVDWGQMGLGRPYFIPSHTLCLLFSAAGFHGILN